MRRAARTDSNHRPLFDLAIALGAKVAETYQLGKGIPDGWVYAPRRGLHWYAVEIKTEDGTLTPDQEMFHACGPVEIWRTEADVLLTLGITRRKHRTSRKVRASAPPQVVVDGYRRCALETCGKILPDDASDNQRYCKPLCSDRARRQRGEAR